jgi:4-methyl-5(b-hydroxyethyl)-thiazole monophosphate biosynthesis
MARVLIPLATGFEDLEAVTLSDLLRRAGIEVITAGLDAGIIQGSRGTRLLPDQVLEYVLNDEFDLIVLPGGMPGAENLKNDVRVLTLLRRQNSAGKYVAAICAAPMVLAAAGLLEGRRATSYPGFLDNQPDTITLTDPVVVDGKIATSRGPGTAMDFALTLIELLVGPEIRNQVEAGLVRP